MVIRTGLMPVDERWVELDRFDAIDIVVRPGQQWYRAGDLVFRLGQIETFRLAGVVRPDTFRHIRPSARQGYLARGELALPLQQHSLRGLCRHGC